MYTKIRSIHSSLLLSCRLLSVKGIVTNTADLNNMVISYSSNHPQNIQREMEAECGHFTFSPFHSYKAKTQKRKYKIKFLFVFPLCKNDMVKKRNGRMTQKQTMK